MYQVNVKIVLKVPGLPNWPVTPPSLWALQERTGSQDRPHPSDPRNEERGPSHLPLGNRQLKPFPQQGAHSGQGHGHLAIWKDPVRPSHELDAQVRGQDSRAAPGHSRCGAEPNAPKSQQSSLAAELGKGINHHSIWDGDPGAGGRGGLVCPKPSQLGSGGAGGAAAAPLPLPAGPPRIPAG